MRVHFPIDVYVQIHGGTSKLSREVKKGMYVFGQMGENYRQKGVHMGIVEFRGHTPPPQLKRGILVYPPAPRCR